MIWFSLLILAVLLLAIGLWFLQRFYAKASLDTALIRTGFGGRKVVVDGACLALPVLHRVQKVSMQAITISLLRVGKDAVLTKDQLRADLEMEFELRAAPDPDAIATAAQALGMRIASSGDAAGRRSHWCDPTGRRRA